jgi:hypothetical protein
MLQDRQMNMKPGVLQKTECESLSTENPQKIPGISEPFSALKREGSGSLGKWKTKKTVEHG